MTDLLGPAAAGAPRAIASSDPSITATIQFPDAADTWFQDCVNNTAGTGTPYVAEWANRQLQQIRRVIRNSGIALPYADDQLGYAIQQGLQWVGTFGGAANALTATMVPAPATLVAGTEIKGLVAATNTGPATLNVNGIGAFPVTGADGTALTGGEIVVGGAASFIYTGTSFVLLSPGPAIFQRIIAVNTTFNVNNSIGNDTTGNGTAGAPWASIGHAIKVISTFNLGGNTVTIQLGLTGITYTAPGNFAAPSNGTLVVRGDPAVQASYTVASSPGAGSGVIAPGSGSISLVGFTLKNAGSVPLSNGLFVGGSNVSIQNITFQTASSAVNGHIVATLGGQITIGAGCIINGICASAITAQDGGSIVQSASATTGSGLTFSNAFCVVAGNGSFTVATTGLTWSGGAATGTRVNASLCGTAYTAGVGATFFPGSVTVAPTTGAQVV